MKVSKQLRASVPDTSMAFTFGVIKWPVFHFQLFADISRTCMVERHVQCELSPMHLDESAAPSGSSRLHSSMNFESRNY